MDTKCYTAGGPAFLTLNGKVLPATVACNGGLCVCAYADKLRRFMPGPDGVMLEQDTTGEPGRLFTTEQEARYWKGVRP